MDIISNKQFSRSGLLKKLAMSEIWIVLLWEEIPVVGLLSVREQKRR